jgi:hypothetical protein
MNYSYAGTVKFMCVTYDASRTGLITTRRITAVGVGDHRFNVRTTVVLERD